MTRRDLVLGVVGTALGSLGLVAGVGEGERLDARADHLRDVESDTVYASAEQVPPQDQYDVTQGFTYMYVKGQPLFAFGHGLSYTTFDYTNLRLSSPTVDAQGNIKVSIDVRNTGPRAGDEVPQLYVHQKVSTVKRPAKELRGFARVTLQPGESRTITFNLPAQKLSWYDITRHDFIVSPGEYDVMVGPSSDQAQATTTLTVTK